MSFIILILANVFLLATPIKEFSTIKLEGKPISSDYRSELIDNAFDGNLNTEFKSTLSSYGWIGLKLDSKYVITGIGWGMKSKDKSDYLLGVFEGSNDPTFYDAAPLYMITEEGKSGEVNYATVKVSQPYKYVRYIGPSNKYCVISELEFYSDEEATNELEEDDENNYWYQPTNIPLISIHTEESFEPIDKENYIKSNILIVSNNKKDTKNTASIKVRGNSTARMDKRPYKVKFDSKVKPLGLPAKAKKWTLIANHCDKSLLRNLLSNYVSNLIEMEYTPGCESVDLILNGEYKGNYLLCDFLEQGKNRADVEDMDKSCIDEPCVTGGYFFAADGWAMMEGKEYYTTNLGIVYSLHYPDKEDIVKEQESYITNTFNDIEAKAYDGTIDDVDIESFNKYLLIEDLCGNGETYWSAYMTKRRGDPKFYFGPIWDMDLAFDNDNRCYPTLEKYDFIYKWGWGGGSMDTFATKVLSQPEVLQNLKDIWNGYTQSKLTKQKLINFVDEQKARIYQSQRLNFLRWDILNTPILLNPVVRGSFDAEADYLKEYVQKRFDIVTTIVNKATVESIKAPVDNKISLEEWNRYKK